MSQQYNDDNRGVLFKNDKQGNEKRPDYTGKINVEGKDYQLSAWIKEGRSGKFMSLSVQEPRKQGSEPAQHRASRQAMDAQSPSPRGGGATGFVDMEDDIPF